jgi:hypothetical protein
MRKFLRDNGLSIFFGVLLLAALTGQAIAGHAEYNNEETQHAKIAGDEPDTISLGRYVVSSSFGRAVLENWQSEYLQFFLFILMTTWLVQRGSPESKEVGKEGTESEEEQMLGEHAKHNSPRWAKAGGLRAAIYSNSLLLVMGTIFVLSWFGQSVTGWSDFNSDELQHEEGTLSWFQYIGTASFWEETLQNWQSEFLAVGCMAVFTIYLRQRGSPESKPVGAPHSATGVEG